jgi:hypothetical protein
MLLKFIKDKGFIKAGDIESIKNEAVANEYIESGDAEIYEIIEELPVKKSKIKE